MAAQPMTPNPSARGESSHQGAKSRQPEIDARYRMNTTQGEVQPPSLSLSLSRAHKHSISESAAGRTTGHASLRAAACCRPGVNEMNSMRYTVNGEEPRVVGRICTGLVLLHFYDRMKISNQVNVAHLKFDEQWYRLYFECGTVFWRKSQDRPEVPVNSTLEYGLVLNDLSEMSSVVGQVVESISYAATEAGDVELRVDFAAGTAVNFVYSAVSDSTRCHLAGC